MTAAEIRKQIEAIGHAVSIRDFEAAHTIEDELHQRVLRAIANGECENPKEAAAEALYSNLIKFDRWAA